ncbi:HupE/UreJ family protein [Mangrovicoccus sp. HB161399]|uniref:HupE/UreJ family protein n=1 Tax=Mangrovicoccus sp. HB161399 TaxID=2720392 RepID=UPI001553D908|nr:HupE/UreJ family protein [Mangrovicoccus sp. HB161399]
MTKLSRLALPAALLSCGPALAHHAMGGVQPSTALQSVISGLAHPVIGIDHLAFVVLAGLASLRQGRILAGPAAFALACVAGCALMLAGVALPFAELAITGSVLLLGVMLAGGTALARLPLLPVLGFFGLFHGWAYGASMIGAQTGNIAAYMAGFAIIQTAIGAGTALLARRLRSDAAAIAARERLAAALCAGVGAALLIETAEAMIFA